ncbi:3'-5' exonuclease, partial [Paraglaciecola sp.]|uniref:3'-5' exonuclease n=1 Tax=Paraglaciecola sp. TaxID=1920173 RepID=UPI003EF8686F
RLHMLSPDDLLSGLQKALLTGSNNNSDSNTNSNTDCTHANTNAQTLTLNDNNNALAAAIRQAYPAALIDEFQDTDPVQFDVFSEIYSNPTDLKQEFGQPHSKQQLNQNLCWIMIGDPKQAIYAFRGADIFTYIEAKKRIDPTRHFTLATNWRSAPKLVQAINHLFESSAKGFLFENNIPFYPVSAGKNVQGFEVQGQVIQSLHFEHYCDQNSPIVAASAAQPILAINMANQISKWLSLANQGQANINGKPVSAGDCCVLVRTRYEADIVKLALAEVNVDSVYLSRSSVFQTDIAKDLFRLLKAMSQPSEEKLLKTALMSELFSLNTEQLDELFNDELVWQNVLEQRFLWFQAWSKQGVMRALKLAFNFFNVEQELLANFKDGLRRITDLQHLVELLQQQSLQLVGESQLIHWFEASILEPDANSESQQMRLESDSNLVQIITLHASKGLEFPLVFIPFAADYKVSKDAIYHNQNEALEVDFLQQDTSLFKSEFERLAEDIRLLYVAVTRAVYYCQIGLWNNALGKNKKVSGFSQSAIGNILLSESEPADAEVNSTISNDHIAQRLMQLAQEHDVSYARFSEIPPLTKYVESNKQDLQQLSCLTLNSPVTRSWRLTSYSAISRQQIHLDVPSPGLDEGHDHDTNIETSPESNYLLSEEMNELVQSPFTFERGANAGSFLHGVLENLDFQNLDNMPEVIEKQSIKFSIDTSWFECLQTWLTDVIHAPISFLNKDNPHVSGNAKQLSLSALSSQQVKVEMEFYMPLHQVQVEDFNQVINGFYPQYHRHYQFDDLNGMIKGYIDLIFEFEGKFFVADYKSNHLGESFNAYDEVAMQHCMTEHDYHLQAILYTLALHRWLKNRLLDYEYSTHVGGAYYLFVRGMTTQQVSKTPCANGVYFMKPEQALIENLDRLFSGDASQISLNQHQDNNAETEQQGQLGLW